MKFDKNGDEQQKKTIIIIFANVLLLCASVHCTSVSNGFISQCYHEMSADCMSLCVCMYVCVLIVNYICNIYYSLEYHFVYMTVHLNRFLKQYCKRLTAEQTANIIVIIQFKLSECGVTDSVSLYAYCWILKQ